MWLLKLDSGTALSVPNISMELLPASVKTDLCFSLRYLQNQYFWNSLWLGTQMEVLSLIILLPIKQKDILQFLQQLHQPLIWLLKPWFSKICSKMELKGLFMQMVLLPSLTLRMVLSTMREHLSGSLVVADLEFSLMADLCWTAHQSIRRSSFTSLLQLKGIPLMKTPQEPSVMKFCPPVSLLGSIVTVLRWDSTQVVPLMQ